MSGGSTPRPQWDDLKKIFKKITIVFTDHDLIHPDPCDGELGCNYPNPILNLSDVDHYGVILVYLDRHSSEDSLMVTLLHEIIHIWLYTKGVFEHDEDWIDSEAERIFNLNKNLVKKYVYRLLPSLKSLINKQQEEKRDDPHGGQNIG